MLAALQQQLTISMLRSLPLPLLQTTAAISAPGSRLLLTTLNQASGIWLHSEQLQAAMVKAKLPAHLRQWPRQFRTFCSDDVKPWLEDGCDWGVTQVVPADVAAQKLGLQALPTPSSPPKDWRDPQGREAKYYYVTAVKA
jgi:hypothetical protein